jgi:hypothetical protein
MAWTPSVALWTWTAGGLATLGIVGYLIKEALTEDDAALRLLIPGLVVAGLGSVVLSLHVLGIVRTGLVAWRVGSVLYVGVAIVLTTFRAGKLNTSAHAANALNLAVAAVSTACSFLLPAVPSSAGAGIASAVTQLPPIVISGVNFWTSVALGALGLGGAVSFILFIRRVERGGTPQIETHWGGLGGGIGGWRMSSSLTYLAASAIFGLLFTMFVMTLSRDKDKNEGQTQPANGAASSVTTPLQPGRS